MNIRNFTFSGVEYPVSFPFEAICELMGSLGFRAYASIYQSPTHQLEILKVGLKWGSLSEGKPWKKPDAQVKMMAKANMPVLAAVFKFYDKELDAFFELYKSDDQAADGGSEEDEGK